MKLINKKLNKSDKIALTVAGGGIFLWFLGAAMKKRRKETPPPMVIDPPITIRPAALQALREEQLWQGLTESDEAAAPLLSKYWAVLNQSQAPDIPWSGAFISWVLKKVDPNFSPSGSHLNYARAAWKNRGRAGSYAPYDPKTERFEILPGDVILRSRSGETVSFSDVMQGGDFKKTHGDIVTAVGPDSLEAVGGNKRNTVTSETYPVDHNGMPTDPNVFAILRWQPRASVPTV